MFPFLQGLAIPLADAEKLRAWTETRQWKALLHYKPNLLGRERSLVDRGDFFFSPEGGTNPQAEAEAFVDGLRENRIVGKLKQTVACAFPERTRFVTQVAKIEVDEKILKQKCELYDKFLAQFHNPQKVSLVFSSAYPNNPASMFGHTFLKIHSARGADLIDIGINYAAVVSEEENPFAFFWFGITGGYDGQWSTQPYYVKVQEYISSESRDLWEYEMNLSEAEVLHLINHIWELETNSWMDYYFFDENCSYQVLAAVEAIKPEWNLLTYNIALVPGESVKFFLEEKNSVREIKYRPSSFKKAMQKFNALDRPERNAFYESMSTRNLELSGLNALTLEAMLADLEFKRNLDKEKFKKEWEDFENQVRSKRAGLGRMPADQEARIPTFDKNSRPDIGHDVATLDTSIGYRTFLRSDQDTAFFRLKFKLAYHDLLNSDVGYTPFAHIDFPWVDVRYYQRQRRWSLHELGGIETTSVSPRTHLHSPWSFRAKGSIKEFDRDMNNTFHYLLGEAGGGWTLALDSQMNHRLYLFFLAAADVSEKFYRGYRVGPAIEVGSLNSVTEKYKLHLILRAGCNLNDPDACYGENSLRLEQSLSLGRNSEIRNTNQIRTYNDAQKSGDFVSTLNYLFFFN